MPSRTEPAAGLLIATILAALLATAAAVLISSARSAHEAVADEGRIEAARLQASGMIDAAIVEMDRGDTVLRLDGSPTASPYAQGGILRLQDVAGLVDLNAANASQLAALLRGAGYAPDTAEALSARIVDWRSAPVGNAPDGASDADYTSAGLPPPPHRPFLSEREVGQVLGVGPALAACLEPELTVFSGSPAVDTAVAPAGVKALAGLATTAGSGASLGVPIGHVVIVSAEAPISRQAALRQREWVRLTGDARRPFMVHRTLVDFVPEHGAGPAASCAPLGAAGGRT
jgi:general secretion pathway protein K